MADENAMMLMEISGSQLSLPNCQKLLKVRQAERATTAAWG